MLSTLNLHPRNLAQGHYSAFPRDRLRSFLAKMTETKQKGDLPDLAVLPPKRHQIRRKKSAWFDEVHRGLKQHSAVRQHQSGTRQQHPQGPQLSELTGKTQTKNCITTGSGSEIENSRVWTLWSHDITVDRNPFVRSFLTCCTSRPIPESRFPTPLSSSSRPQNTRSNNSRAAIKKAVHLGVPTESRLQTDN